MSKFHNKKTVVDGITFDSQMERRRYEQLKLLKARGVIRNLQLQPKFLLVEGFNIGKKRMQPIYYKADFSYDENGVFIVEDVKGVETREFRLKRKLFRRRYGFEIKVVKMK